MHTHVAVAKAKAAEPHTTPTSVMILSLSRVFAKMILSLVISAGTKKRPAATAEDARGYQRMHNTMRAARKKVLADVYSPFEARAIGVGLWGRRRLGRVDHLGVLMPADGELNRGRRGGDCAGGHGCERAVQCPSTCILCVCA